MAEVDTFPRELPAQQSSWLSLLELSLPCFGKPAAPSVSLASKPEFCLLPLQQFKTGQETVCLPYAEKEKEGKRPHPEQDTNAFGSRTMCQKHQYCLENQNSPSPGRWFSFFSSIKDTRQNLTSRTLCYFTWTGASTQDSLGSQSTLMYQPLHSYHW